MALKLLLDANTSKALSRALARHAPELDVLRVQDTPHAEAKDPVVLEFAAAESRILVSRDKKTLCNFAIERIEAGKAFRLASARGWSPMGASRKPRQENPARLELLIR